MTISRGKVEGILNRLNEEAKNNIRTAINDIEIEFEKSITLLKYMLESSLSKALQKTRGYVASSAVYTKVSDTIGRCYRRKGVRQSSYRH
ncbi:MAG TPA: hypothetical protein VFI73_11845 [Candidatus Nitrosopolaris sp.]|nr:hypothetical protein [Candidatus Nitrosopolaris sp.]